MRINDIKYCCPSYAICTLHKRGMNNNIRKKRPEIRVYEKKKKIMKESQRQKKRK